MKSLKDSLLQLIKSRGQLSYSDALSFSMEEGYRASNMERRMRELCKEENIEPIMAISKRNTEYVNGWRLRAYYVTSVEIPKDFQIEPGKIVMINNVSVPIFAGKEKNKKEIKETSSPEYLL